VNHGHESDGGGTAWRSDGPLAALSRSPKISELVARELARRIIDERLEEGTMLPNERELIEIFHVGRTTLREALRLLETRGVITIRTGPRGGPIVRRPRPDDLSDVLTLTLQFEGAALADVLEARVVAEPAITRLAADRITDEELAELEEATEAMAAATGDGAAFVEQNIRFHRLIGEVAGSVALQVFLRSLESIVQSEVSGIEYSPRQRKKFVEDHARIVEALRARDGDAAAAAMRDHLEAARQFWQRKYAHLVSRRVHWV
jgi:DNA-binding FadR family transcriptional regulator